MLDPKVKKIISNIFKDDPKLRRAALVFLEAVESTRVKK